MTPLYTLLAALSGYVFFASEFQRAHAEEQGPSDCLANAAHQLAESPTSISPSPPASRSFFDTLKSSFARKPRPPGHAALAPERTSPTQGARSFEIIDLHGRHEAKFSETTAFGKAAGITDRGDPGVAGHDGNVIPVRKYNHNEDGIVGAVTKEGTLVLVAIDGMGGHGKGQEASYLIGRSLIHSIVKDGENLNDAVKAAAVAINEAAERGKLPTGETVDLNLGTGAVLAGLEINGNQGKIMAVGDSRAIVVREGTWVRRTRDQSPYWNRVNAYASELKTKLKLSEQEALDRAEQAQINAADKNLTGNALAVGGFLRPLAVEEVSLLPNDWVVIGSDGLWDNFTHHEVAQIVSSATTPDGAVTRLREQLKERVTQRGGTDNVSIIVYQQKPL